MTETAKEPQLLIKAQYVKDQSFENPNAPEVFAMMQEEPPKLEISIDVTPVNVTGQTYEVTLSIRADAKIGQTAAFVAELDYAGLVILSEGLNDDQLQHLLMVETPRHLFPFSRAILASTTRDGGFPPLVVNPIDFAELYQKRGGKLRAEPAEAQA